MTDPKAPSHQDSHQDALQDSHSVVEESPVPSPLPGRSGIALLQSQSLPSLVAQEIEALILDGRLLPGAKLSEIPLAAHLGVSRGPVREAFRALAEKGLVRVEKNRGVYVRAIELEEAAEIYEVRCALEELIVRKLAQVITPEQLARLGQLLDAMEAAARSNDLDRYHPLNLQFHDRMAVFTGNARLADTYRRLVNELALSRHRAHARRQGSLLESVAEHRAVVQALAERNIDDAVSAIRAHVEKSLARVRRAGGAA